MNEANANQVVEPVDDLEKPLTDQDGSKASRIGKRVKEIIDRLQRPRVQPKRDLTQDRTRSLLILIGGTVGAGLLFLGVFSTPPAKPVPTDHQQARPNLGRRVAAVGAPHSSLTPLLSANLQAEDASPAVSAMDIQNTAQHETVTRTAQDNAVNRLLQVRSDEGFVNGATKPSGPTATEASTNRRYGSLSTSPSSSARSGPDSINANSSVRSDVVPTVRDAGVLAKPSIVFVRSSTSAPAAPSGMSDSASTSAIPTLLPPGSRLIARLESAVTNALKAPVIANIEYNYERDGAIVVPAGTKVVGELQQASSNGFVGISFHTLRFADGRDEKIEAIAMSLQSEPLKGEVSGTNNGKRMVTRALSGVGTVAAYIVGGGASDLGKPISGSMLLRDRIAGNVALAGEQELTNNLYSTSTVVTLPAQTRLYVVLQKPALQQAREEKNEPTSAHSGTEMPSVQELRELMSLKREIDQMYEASKTRTNAGK